MQPAAAGKSNGGLITVIFGDLASKVHHDDIMSKVSRFDAEQSQEEERRRWATCTRRSTRKSLDTKLSD